MTTQEKLQFYKEFYSKEIDDRDHLNDAVSLPISIISALLAGIFYLVINFNFHGLYLCVVVFIILLFFSCMLTFLAIYYLIRSYTSFKGKYVYKGLPYSIELNEYNSKLVDAAVKAGHAANTGENAFDTYLKDKYVAFVDHNARINDTRRALFVTSKKMLVFAVFSISLSFIPYIVNYFQKKDPVTKVEIVKTYN